MQARQTLCNMCSGKQSPSFFRETYSLNKCLFVTTNFNNYQNFLVTLEFAVGKHQTNKFCNKNEKCKFHILLYGDDIQKKLAHLEYDYEKVNCPYSYFKFYIILSEKVVCLNGNFLMEPLLSATKYNRLHRSKECITSLLWRRIGRKKRRRYSPIPNCKMPESTVSSLVCIAQMQIAVVCRLLEILQQLSEISTKSE